MGFQVVVTFVTFVQPKPNNVVVSCFAYVIASYSHQAILHIYAMKKYASSERYAFNQRTTTKLLFNCKSKNAVPVHDDNNNGNRSDIKHNHNDNTNNNNNITNYNMLSQQENQEKEQQKQQREQTNSNNNSRNSNDLGKSPALYKKVTYTPRTTQHPPKKHKYQERTLYNS